MPRRKPVELNVNHERWLVSYADFITLLFAFFVVMYSVSQVNESKYRVLSDTLLEAFNPSRSLKPVQVGELSRAPSTSAIDLSGEPSGASGQAGGPGELEQLSELFTEQFSSLIDEQLVQVDSNEFWLQIEVKDSILFSSGSAEPSPQAQAIFADIAGILEAYDNPVQVEGHTDNLPIRNRRYPSNWELSSARAAAMVKLLEAEGVAATRLSAVGYGEHQPAASNATPEGRARNRRVALMIAKAKMERPRESLERGLGQSETPTTGEQSQEDEAQAETQASSESSTIAPVELEGGGLLFSSDPDLSRESQ